jgi:hypothetical protein
VVSIGLLRESLRGLRKFGCPGIEFALNSQATPVIAPRSGPRAPRRARNRRLWPPKMRMIGGRRPRMLG